MSMRSAVVGAALLAAAAPAAAFAAGKPAQGPGLGRPATPEEVAGWDIDVTPDGKGLPPGSGDAKQGAPVYAVKCASCHGKQGEGYTADELVGGVGTLTEPYPILTVGSYWPYATTLFDYLRRAMPPEAPLSLKADELYGLSAYLLYLNGIIGEDETLDAETLPRIRMPNRDGFVPIYRVPSR